MSTKLSRIDWDTLWMTMALSVAQRSLDPSTKHGCIIVDNKNHLISMGYNSFPRECLELTLPLTRPDKYKVMIHSETNAIINAGDKSLNGATAYITGHPCVNCFGNMINAGISKIIYGMVGSYCIDKKDIEIINQMNVSSKSYKNKIIIQKYEANHDTEEISEFLDNIKEYVDIKTKQDDAVNG